MENSFKYTYSAKEQEEIKRIREKYQIEEKRTEENGMERIRKLDADVTKKATCIALLLGVPGALLMGFGMSLIMTNLGLLLGMNELFSMAAGILIGLFGMLMAAMAYPAYKKAIKKGRRKAAPEILKLTEELMR